MSPDSDAGDFPGAGEESDYPDFHRSTRMPLDAVVRLHFEGTVAYQNGFAANVSATGMYVKHPDPPPLGTRLVFELVLGDERKPVQGAGVVAWAREKYEGPGRPAGIGIQFTEVDSLSRQHIAEALFSYLETQLGDELADSQDVVDLVAASSPRTPLDLTGSMGWSPESEAEVAPPPPSGTTGPMPRFRSSSDGSELRPAFPLFDEPPVPGLLAAEGGLFTPEIPPDLLDGTPSAPERRTRSPWPAVAIGVAIAVVGFAGWWYLAGPGSMGDVEPIRSAPISRPASARPKRPALNPAPGPEKTLAEVVGAEAVEAPEPLPVDGGAAAAAPESEAGGGLEVGDAAAPQAETGTSPAGSPAPSAVSESPVAAPAAPAASPPSAAPATASGRATRVSSIDWEESSARTVVVLTGDAGFPPGSYKWNEIRDANPRVLLRFSAMSAGYPKTLLPAGTPELKQVRIGYHEKPGGNELHVVLDLAASNVKVESVAADGNRLYVRLARP